LILLQKQEDAQRLIVADLDDPDQVAIGEEVDLEEVQEVASSNLGGEMDIILEI